MIVVLVIKVWTPVSVAKDKKVSGGEDAVLVGSHLYSYKIYFFAQKDVVKSQVTFEEICPEVSLLVSRLGGREVLGGGEGSPPLGPRGPPPRVWAGGVPLWW